ncbi:MAG: hypothetical protein M1480_12815 [Bacteroidetes bacterium]|nr:hypothetical protein [Bacteroidota bacterium]
MKSNSSIYLFSSSLLFNKEAVPNFDNFNNENSYQLYSSLLLNHKEILDNCSKSYRIIFCFDDNDKSFIPKEFRSNNEEIIFGDLNHKIELLKLMSDKYFSNSSNNLLIFSNSIGISFTDIQKAFNLLSIEDEAIVIGKTNRDKIVFIGFNSFNKELFLDLNWDSLNYDNLLARIGKHDNFLHVLGNYLAINDIIDFKNLYVELSKKESLSYCSQNMHERFTNLFIEYKELLK